MPETLRVAVLGAGSHSAIHHGPSLRDLCAGAPGEIRLAAVCDLDLAKARSYAEEFGFAKTHSDLHEMMRTERLDALVVVTPVAATRGVVGELIPYRVPLLIEKPPGLHSGEARELLELARESGTPVMVSFNRRFSPALTRTRDWMRTAPDAPRRMRAVLARMLRVSRVEREFITGTGIHLTDTVLSLLGPVAELRSCRWSSERGGESCLAAITDRQGLHASLLMAPDAGSDEETYELIGDQFQATVDTTRCALRIRERGKLVMEWSAAEGSPQHETGGSLAETRAFLDGVRSRSTLSPSLEQALQSMLACEAMERGGTSPGS